MEDISLLTILLNIIVYGIILIFFAMVLGVPLFFGWCGFTMLKFFPLWLESKAAGVPMSMWRQLVMQFRKIDRNRVFEALKILRKAGVNAKCSELEDHILAGGDLERVRAAAVAVDKAGLKMGFAEIARLDLAGRDVALAVEQHVNPQVLSCSPKNSNGIISVAKDGIALAVKMRVTVRTRLDTLIGAASEQTVLARVGEGIVATVGRAASHREIMERPSVISEALLERNLDRNTCYEILSIDVEDVSIVDNVAARLQSIRAATDKRIAQARAEERRAGAVAVAQEMKARTISMNALVTEKRAILPNALSAAFRAKNCASRPWRMLVDTRDKWRCC